MEVQSKFLFIAIFFGVVFIFLTPPFQVPDEGSHFIRSYALSQGNIFPTAFNFKRHKLGNMMNAAIDKVYHNFSQLQFHPKNKVTLKEVITATKIILADQKEEPVYYNSCYVTYFPIFHLPQTLGIIVGRSFNLPVLFYLYIGRIFNLTVWILVMYVAIRMTPIFKWVFLLLALAPMSLFEASSLSYDAGLNAASFFVIAFLLRLILDATYSLSNLRIALIFLLGALISLAKGGVYFPLVILFFFIPSGKFINFRSKVLLCIGLCLNSLIIYLYWGAMTKEYFIFDLYRHVSISGYHSVLSFPFSHPIVYLDQLMKIVNAQSWRLVESFIGVFGWGDAYLPKEVIYAYLMLIIFIALLDHDNRIRITFSKKLVFILIFVLISFILINVEWLLNWHKSTDKIPLQGRYWTPIGILFFLFFYNNRLNKELAYFIAPISCVLMLLTTSVVLYQRYWHN